jgi:hypothetical protein
VQIFTHLGSAGIGRQARRGTGPLPACLIVVTVFAVSGCASRPTSPPPDVAPSTSISAGQTRSVSTDALTRTVAALCQVRQDAARSVPQARATFYDRVHEGLHDLARAVQSKDRAVAARLLEAKTAVEQDSADWRNWPRLQADLLRLLVTARDALRALSLNPPECAR